MSQEKLAVLETVFRVLESKYFAWQDPFFVFASLELLQSSSPPVGPPPMTGRNFARRRGRLTKVFG